MLSRPRLVTNSEGVKHPAVAQQDVTGHSIGEHGTSLWLFRERR